MKENNEIILEMKRRYEEIMKEDEVM